MQPTTVAADVRPLLLPLLALIALDDGKYSLREYVGGRGLGDCCVFFAGVDFRCLPGDVSVVVALHHRPSSQRVTNDISQYTISISGSFTRR